MLLALLVLAAWVFVIGLVGLLAEDVVVEVVVVVVIGAGPPPPLPLFIARRFWCERAEGAR